MLDQLGALPLFRHKLLLTLIVMAALLLALVVSFAPVRKASADSPPPFLLEQTIGGLNLAYNLAVAANDDIRVIDRDPFDPNVGITGELKAFDKDGAPLPTNTALIEPGGIAISTTGNSVLSELFTITVRQPDGTFISSFVIDQNSFGLAINADGNYLVAQSDGGNSGRLAVYSPAGVLLDSYGDSDPLDSNTFGVEVFGVALDASGNIYASDVNNGRVLLFDSDGTFNSVFATGIGRPQGVAVDSAGNVYVSNRGAFPGNVQVFQPDGALLTTFSLPDEPGVVGFDPRGIAVDSQDRVIVGDGAFVRIFSAGLVSLWKAEGDALDDHGDNDGTLFGDAGFDANSQVGQGFLLDGSGDYVRVPHNTNLDPGTGSFTIKGWIKTSVADNFQGIVSKSERSGAQGENNPSFYVLQTDSIGNFRVSLQNDDTSQFSQVFLGSTLVADGAFHHIAFVRDVLAGEARLYVDGAIDLGATTQYFSPGWGAAQACDPTGCALQPGALGSIAAFANDTEADPLIIGGEDRVNDLGVASFFSGVIDELEFFNIALSSAQINAQFVAGGGGPGPGPGPGPGGPTIFFVSPFSGPTAGGTDVTIFGFGFVAGASLGVTFDGTAATNVSLNNDGSIAATTPFHAAEDFVDVVATSGDGAVAPTLSGGYFYGTLPTPMITSVDPSSGTTDGGTEVIITGTGFVIAFGFSVTFDGEQAASFPVFPSDTSITVTTPAHAAGAVDVVVTNPDGQTATSSYTYGAGAQVTHTMTLNKDGTGTGTVTGAGVHNEGSEVAITAVADAGSTFDGWGGPDGADCTDGLVTMDADKSCTATFTLVTHTLTLNKVGTGTGTVTGAGVHNEGSEVAITAVADAGSTFDGWSGPDGADCTDGLVTMDADKSCTATFTLVTHTLTLNKVGTGTGTVTGAGVHNEGSEVAITAVADAGSTFDGWSGPDGADCTDGLVTMDADKSCTATFTLVTHTLTLNKVGTGTGTVTGAGVHNEGSEVAITAVADAGSTFDGWSGPDGADCTDGLVTMDADKSCTATFSQTPPGGDPVQAALDKLSQLRIALNDPDLDLQGDSKSKNKGRNNLRWFNNQLDALEANINAPLFEDALADANNILGKVDGCEAGGAPDPNDKVRTCLDGQDVVDLLVRELILLLEDLVS